MPFTLRTSAYSSDFSIWTSMFFPIAVLGAWLFAFSSAEAGKQPDKQDRDDPPTFFTLYSSNGNEKFQAECSQESAEVVNRKFLGTRIRRSANNKTLIPNDKLSDKGKKHLKEGLLGPWFGE